MSSLADHLGAPLVAEGVLDQHMVYLPERLLDLLPTAVYVCDRDGAILGWNRRAVELWGRTPKLRAPPARFCGSPRLYRVDRGPPPHAGGTMAATLPADMTPPDPAVMRAP